MSDFVNTTIPRLVAPFFPGIVWRAAAHDTDGAPCLYLTFDDGPDPASTPALLDCLAAHNAAATFFVLGEQVAQHTDLVAQIVHAGHRIGLHGWTHTDPWKTPRATTLDAFERAAALLDSLGVPARDVRPPYGRFTPALRRWCRDTNRRLVLWDLLPGDFVASATPEIVAHRIVQQTRPGSLIVLHEGPHAGSIARAALAQALPVLRVDGWRFASL
ncbi:MAG: polysaccharide deacetylase family protein [Rhodothermaceae bacterium]|nr:polysaccharide deacetylase family protein [Rhodothermaceae bacterium]